MKVSQLKMAPSDALRVRSAEFWLRLGEPVQALLELQKLRGQSTRHPRAQRVFRAARQAFQG